MFLFHVSMAVTMTTRRWLPRRSRLLLLLAATAGCGPNLAAISSGEIGCSPEEITITHDQAAVGERTWNAECAGHTYYCSAIRIQGVLTLKCENSSGSPTPVAAKGCQYDTQCKADRICRAGQCVAPTESGEGDAPSRP